MADPWLLFEGGTCLHDLEEIVVHIIIRAYTASCHPPDTPLTWSARPGHVTQCFLVLHLRDAASSHQLLAAGFWLHWTLHSS